MDLTTGGMLEHRASSFPEFSRSKTLIPLSTRAISKKTILPPLLCAREHTVPTQKSRSKTRSLPPGAKPNITENHDYHWNLEPPRKLDDRLDGRIVKHLRKKLNRRLEKRILTLMGEELQRRQREASAPAAADNDGTNTPNHTNLHKVASQLTGLASELNDEENFNIEVPTPRDQPISKETKSSLLPDISQRLSLTIQDEEYNALNDVGGPVRESRQGRVPVQESPAPTPHLKSRPRNILNTSQNDDAFLMGRINAKCIPERNLIFFYLQSCHSDMEAERGELLFRAHPRIKSLCLGWNYDIRIMDPHWGTRDLVSDDHTIHEMLLQLIDQTTETGAGHEKSRMINFMTLLGQKYGEPMPPESIPKDEFEKIEEVLDNETSTTKSKMASIEQENTEASAKRLWLSSRARDKSAKGEEDQEKPTKEKSKTPKTPKTPKTAGTSKSSNSTSTQREASSVSTKGIDKIKLSVSILSKPVTREDTSVVLVKQDHVMLKSWYTLDMNANPPVYRLQRISSHHKEILLSDPSKRSQARSVWLQTARRLQKILCTCANKLFDDPDAIAKYETSFTENELSRGILSKDARGSQSNCYWMQREIEDIESGVGAGDNAVKDYIDITPMSSVIDKRLQKALEILRKNKLAMKMSFRNIRKYTVIWGPHGIDPHGTRAHSVYCDRFVKDFYEIMLHTLVKFFKGERQHKSKENKTALLNEVKQHIAYCQKMEADVVGRKVIIQKVKDYLDGEGGRPLVLYGAGGCGLTSIMAKAVVTLPYKIEGAATVVRMVGLTGDTFNIRTLLRSLCLQLSYIFEQNPNRVPHDMKGLSNTFEFLCNLSSDDHKLVIIIDSLHLLSDEHEGRKLAWLPRAFPSSVYFIASTQSEERFGCLKAFKKAYSDTNDFTLEVPAIENNEAAVMVSHWLEDAGRRLTGPQRELIMETFTKCMSPLYLRMLVNDALQWASHMDISNVKFGTSVKNIATVMLGKFEKDYGEALTRRILGYITAAKKGMMVVEMEDLLSLDEAVMDEVSNQNRIGMRRLPPLMLLRMMHNLKPYLHELRADNMLTLTWRHIQIADAAVERYLNNRDKAPSYHKAIAEYFLDTWHDRPKPFGTNEKGVKRGVIGQPLYREQLNEEGESVGRTYNLRKLNELPYHLLKSQQNDVLKKSCLCNFEFILAKITASGLQSIMDDLQMALSAEPNDMDLKLLSDTLHLSSTALNKDPRQLASQVVGRLDTIIRQDKPVAPSDPVLYPALKPFFAQALKSSTPSLLPSAACLSQPGSVLYDLLSGHTDGITAVVISTNGQRAFTSSLDDTLKVWELRTGRVTKTIMGVGKNVLHIRLGLKASLAITSETNGVRVWDVDKGECVYQIDSDDPATVGTASEGTVMVTFFHGCSRMKSWKLDGEIKNIIDLDYELENPEQPAQGIHKDNSTLIAGNSHGDNVLHAFKDDNYAMVRNAKSGGLIYKLSCKKASSIQALAISREYFICAVRFKHNLINEMHQIEAFDVTNGQPHRVVVGCVMDNFSEIFVNQVGSHVVAVSYSEQNQSSEIVSWNIETEEHKHLAKHAKVSKFGACVDLRYILTASNSEPTLRIWNLSTKINQPSPKEKPVNGVECLVPMTDNPRYLIAKSFKNGPLSVWNITKSRYSGEVVNTERGLVEQSDIVLVHNNKLVILAEKGPSNVGKSGHVFQTIHVYDMIAKKYIQRLSGCYVFPSPVHEYVILDDEQLMGLSENRNHLVIWSLTTGHIIHRIKPNFKAEYSMGDKDMSNIRKRATTAQMTPWQRRSETVSAKKRRHQREIEEEKANIEAVRKEKENSIEQFIISKDYSTIVASFYAHHMCVFDVESKTHTQTLESPTSMLFLHIAALTSSGGYLVHTNYDDETKNSYVTLWNCKTGLIRKRLRNERNVQAIAISDDVQRVVFGKKSQELRIWEPFQPNSLRKIKGYPSLNFGIGSVIHIVDNGSKAIVFAGDISLWDLTNGVVLSVFTPDMKIQTLTVALDGKLVVFGLKDTNKLVSLKMLYPGAQEIEKAGENWFSEEVSDDEDDDFEEFYEDAKKQDNDDEDDD